MPRVPSYKIPRINRPEETVADAGEIITHMVWELISGKSHTDSLSATQRQSFNRQRLCILETLVHHYDCDPKEFRNGSSSIPVLWIKHMDDLCLTVDNLRVSIETLKRLIGAS